MRNKKAQHRWAFLRNKSNSVLHQTSFHQCVKRAILGDGLDRFAGKFQTNVVTKFWNPNALVLKVRGNFTFHYFGYVTTDTAFFLGQTGTMNATAGTDVGTSNAANT
jgi:hypothetical protein